MDIHFFIFHKTCLVSFWYKNSPFYKIIFSGHIEPKKFNLVSLEIHDSTLSNDIQFNFFDPTRPEKIILENGDFFVPKRNRTGFVEWREYKKFMFL